MQCLPGANVAFSLLLLLSMMILQVGGEVGPKNNTESVETDIETDKHDDDEVGSSSNLREILRENLKHSLGR